MFSRVSAEAMAWSVRLNLPLRPEASLVRTVVRWQLGSNVVTDNEAVLQYLSDIRPQRAEHCHLCVGSRFKMAAR